MPTDSAARRTVMLPTDPYLALGISIEAYLNISEGAIDPWMVRKIALELGFTHPVEPLEDR